MTMTAQFYVQLGEPGLLVRYAPAEAVAPEPVTLLKGPKGDTGDPGTVPDVPDLTVLFNNGLI